MKRETETTQGIGVSLVEEARAKLAKERGVEAADISDKDLEEAISQGETDLGKDQANFVLQFVLR